MSETELKELRGKLAAYERVKDLLHEEVVKYPPDCPQEKVLRAILRSVESQKKMIEFAIYSREKAM